MLNMTKMAINRKTANSEPALEGLQRQNDRAIPTIRLKHAIFTELRQFL